MNQLTKEQIQQAIINTPLRKDAFDMSDDDKIQEIEYHFRKIMETMGLDLTDDSLRNTPHRVAKMFIQETFSGLNPDNKPPLAFSTTNTTTTKCS